jgi:hypothetical protein
VSGDPSDLTSALPFLAQLEHVTLREWVAVAVACEDALLVPTFLAARATLRERLLRRIGAVGCERLRARVRHVTDSVVEDVRAAYPYVPMRALEQLEYAAYIGAAVWLVGEELDPRDMATVYAAWAEVVPYERKP